MDGFLVSFILFECLVAVVIVIGNCIVCYVIWKSPELQKKVMFIFIFSLSVADLLVGLVAIPCSILTKLGLPHNQELLCISMLSFIMIPTQNSIFNMSAIAIERFAAVKFPIYHMRRLTPKRARYVTVIIWIISTIVGCMPMLGWNRLNEFDVSQEMRPCLFMEVMSFDYMAFNFFACILPPIVINVILYYVIFTSFARHNACSSWMACSRESTAQSSTTCEASLDDITKVTNGAKVSKETDSSGEVGDVQAGGDIKKNGVQNGAIIASTPNTPSQEKKAVSTPAANPVGRRNSQTHQHEHDERKRRKEMKTAGVLLFLVLSFIVCWMPIHICNMIFKFGEGKIDIPTVVIDSAVVTSHSSSAFNFFLYSWRLRSFKIQLHKRFPFLVNNRPL